MKRTVYLLGLVALLVVAVSSCDDVTTTVGSSLVEDRVEVVIDSSFTLTGRSVANRRVQSRTITQLLGRIEAQGYGDLSSTVVTQFMPGIALDTDRFSADNIDSVKLFMQMSNGAYVGDSVMPMGVKVYPLTQTLPSPIYSDFDPSDYYDASDCWGSAIYTATAIGAGDSVRNLAMRSIEVRLPRKLGVDIYNEYKRDPATFQNPQAFARFFPGLYITNSFGNGRVTRIDKSFITMYYHVDGRSETTGRDTTYRYSNSYLAVTPEVITNNNIRYTISPMLTERVDRGEALVVSPTGYDVELTLPARELVAYYHTHAGAISLINSLSVKIPAERIANDYSIQPPATLLMVKKSKADEFFAKNMIPDGVESFYATYSGTTGVYHFSDMRGYMQAMVDKGESNITDDDLEFVLIPVNVVTEYVSSTAVVTGITPYITTPSMCRLLIDKAKVTLSFSKQDVDL